MRKYSPRSAFVSIVIHVTIQTYVHHMHFEDRARNPHTHSRVLKLVLTLFKMDGRVCHDASDKC